MARLSILTNDEINPLYAIPTLDDEERSFLFSLDVEDQLILDTLEKDTARKVDYILQLGYYRAIGYFFLFSFQKVKADVDFIMQLYFLGESLPKKQVSKNHHYHNHCASGTQRYRCQNPSCPTKTFMLRYRYLAYQAGIKEQAVEMALNGSGIRDTARVLKIDKNTIISTLKKKPPRWCRSTPSCLS